MSRRVIPDSNLLLLYVAGLNSKNDIPKLKRLRAYTADDYDLLLRLSGLTIELLLTPNVLTETSNLLRQGAQTPQHARAFERLRLLLEHFRETYVRSQDAFERPETARLGVTDAVLLILGQTGARLITADLDLWRAAMRAGHPAINFNHERDRFA